MLQGKITQYEQHEQNPFIPEAVDNVQIKRRTQMVYPTERKAVHYVVNSETGEIDGHSAFLKVAEVDEERFVKLFLKELGALWELSKPALRVLTYIMNAMRVNEDRIIFNFDECMKYTGYKNRQSIFNGLDQLLENGIIARSTVSYIYFINPMIVFNGSRVTFAKTYIKKQKKEKDPNQLDLFEEPQQLEDLEDEQQTGKTDTTEQDT